MRRLFVALLALSLLGSLAGCRHIAGVCDCDHNGMVGCGCGCDHGGAPYGISAAGPEFAGPPQGVMMGTPMPAGPQTAPAATMTTTPH